jgi:hypothetical protein
MYSGSLLGLLSWQSLARKVNQGWGCGSVVEDLPGMGEALVTAKR